jgi:hypothetical protein
MMKHLMSMPVFYPVGSGLLLLPFTRAPLFTHPAKSRSGKVSTSPFKKHGTTFLGLKRMPAGYGFYGLKNGLSLVF